MIAAPAVDLRGGRCVQLVGGRPEAERVSLPDPIAVAERWYESGFATLHLVDLDAALGAGDNMSVLERLLAATPAVTQVGGGIRDDARAERLLSAGADRIIVGTRALDDADWLERLCDRFPRRVMLALDTRDGVVLRRGWREATELGLIEYMERIGTLPLAGILTTDVGREGRLEGIDRLATAAAIRGTDHPVWISGGVTTTDELKYLESAGAAGAVLGMALYTDTLDTLEVARLWGRDIHTTDTPDTTDTEDDK
jgi:phosphoribosylformimino-5-aminoimidazole carboxamide ribotide isomerase